MSDKPVSKATELFAACVYNYTATAHAKGDSSDFAKRVLTLAETRKEVMMSSLPFLISTCLVSDLYQYVSKNLSDIEVEGWRTIDTDVWKRTINYFIDSEFAQSLISNIVRTHTSKKGSTFKGCAYYIHQDFCKYMATMDVLQTNPELGDESVRTAFNDLFKCKSEAITQSLLKSLVPELVK